MPPAPKYPIYEGRKIVELDLHRAQTRQKSANSSRIHEDVDATSVAELAALRARFARIVPTESPLKPFPWLCHARLFEICRFHLCVCFQHEPEREVPLGDAVVFDYPRDHDCFLSKVPSPLLTRRAIFP